MTYGLADFAAAEELERFRGYWWAPDSSALLVARVDEEPVQVWHIGDPENPGQPAAEHRYPAPVRRTPTSRCGCSASTARGGRSPGTARRTRTS